jgi:single-stranded DNA-binding protein
VRGRLNVRSYEAKDGGKRWVTEVVADFIAISSHPAKTFDDMGTEVARDPEQGEIPF